MSKAIAGHRYLWVRAREDFESQVTLADGTVVDRFAEIE